MNDSLRVVKVGGSLFDWPELRERLHRWLSDAIPADHWRNATAARSGVSASGRVPVSGHIRQVPLTAHRVDV